MLDRMCAARCVTHTETNWQDVKTLMGAVNVLDAYKLIVVLSLLT